MRYVKLIDGAVAEVVLAENPAMPGIPLERRYPASFIAGLMQVEDEIEVHAGWRMLEDGTFEEAPHTPVEETWPVDIESLRAARLASLSAAGNAAIVAGVTVTLPSTGEAEHFALMETDQINLSTAMAAVEQGAAGYPYHADGQLCRFYPAADILVVSQAAIQHKLYHTTYCNHLLVWARRSESAEELAVITYGAELPEDLAANLTAVLAAAGGIANA